MDRKVETQLVIILIIWMSLTLANQSMAQAVLNNSFPRLANYYFAGFYRNQNVVERLSKWDLIIGLRVEPEIPQRLRTLNPNIKLLRYYKGYVFTTGQIPFDQPQWLLNDSSGNPWVPFGGQNAGNFSGFCPIAGGRQLTDAVAQTAKDIIDTGLFDGVMYDYYFNGLSFVPDLDFDNNGINDKIEHGNEWVTEVTRSGLESMAGKTRDLIGSGFLLIGNPASTVTHSYGILNGHMVEGFPGFSTFWTSSRPDAASTDYDLWMATGASPQLFIINGGRQNSKVGRDDFRNVRQGLMWCLMNDGYYSYDGGIVGHHELWWYDEYETDLGYPTGPHVKLPSGIWIRFFDNGVVLFNQSEQTKTITDGELQGLPGYNGPYYKFRGGQDPVWNNGDGTPVASLEIYSAPPNVPDQYGSRELTFDGYILLKNFRTIVSETVIDDAFYSTSPGQDEAVAVGDWGFDGQFGLSALEATFYGNNHDDGYRYSQAGNGENRYNFMAKINVPGSYEVFAWYPDVDRGNATNAPYTVSHASGSDTVQVNQTVNGGKWNSIGIYDFGAGTYGVSISNAANGTVLADAVRFVHLGQTETTPPQSPSGLQGLNVTKDTIELTWNAPLPASDGDLASSYNIHRNGVRVGRTFSTSFIDMGLDENTAYSYSVFSVDKVGNVSLGAANGTFTTLLDMIPPTVLSANALNVATVEVTFDEAIEISSAEAVSNYSIDNGITIISARRNSNPRKVTLATSQHAKGVMYKLTINNIKDMASNANVIASNTTVSYSGPAESFSITITSDNAYELYVNDELLGSDFGWTDAETYVTEFIDGKNVIAIKGIDTGGVAALLAEPSSNGIPFAVTDGNWRISAVEEAGWRSVNFDDSSWKTATVYGPYGTTSPWGTSVDNFPVNTNAQWIWSSDNDADNTVYFRFTIGGTTSDTSPPLPPTGVTLR